MRKLVVINPGPVQRRADGLLSIPAKTLTGLQAYASRWPGETLWVTREVPAEGDGTSEANLGAVWADPARQDFVYEPTDDIVGFVRSLGSEALVVVLLKEWAAPLLDTQASVVLVAELSFATRVRQSTTALSGRLAGARVMAGAMREESQLRAMVRAAAGLQANGYPTWQAYRKLSTSPLLFFDTRLHARQIPPAPRTPRGLGEPLRLAFSGRHIRGKGPEYAVQLVRDLNLGGISATLDVFGRGELEPELRALAGRETTFHGDVPFDQRWVPFVRDNVDLMVLPHVQGDPAGTYLEAAGLGVPVIGFDNDALRALVREIGLGWTVRMRDAASLLSKTSELAASPESLALAASRGLEFMERHSFEREFDRRVEHLLSVG